MYFFQLFADEFQAFDGFHAAFHASAVFGHFSDGAFEGQFPAFHEVVYLSEDFDIFRGIHSVSLRVSVRFEKFAEIIRPVTDQRHVLAEHIRYFTDCVKKPFHNTNPLIDQ